MFLKGLFHAKKETLCLGTTGNTVLLLSIMSPNGEEGSPCTMFSRQHFSAVLCLGGRMIYTPFGTRSTEVAPTIPPCTAWLLSTPFGALQQCQNNCFLGLNAGFDQVTGKLKITQQRNEPQLLSRSSSAWSLRASSCRRQGRKQGTAKELLASKVTNNQISKTCFNLIPTSSNLMELHYFLPLFIY